MEFKLSRTYTLDKVYLIIGKSYFQKNYDFGCYNSYIKAKNIDTSIRLLYNL